MPLRFLRFPVSAPTGFNSHLVLQGNQGFKIGPIPTMMYCAGSADGPYTHHLGAGLQMNYTVAGNVYDLGFQHKGLLGWFRVDQSGKIQATSNDEELDG